MNISAEHLFVRDALQLLGYTQLVPLYQGTRTVVYRAWGNASAQSVVIKYLKQDYPSFGDLVQFRNQYTITQNLSIPGTVKSLRLEPVGNSYALIMEDVDGVSLADYIQQQPLDIAGILAIALQLADILHNLHQQRVIHKDIKPANILIHPDSKQVWLIDFSIASLLPKETQAIQSPKSLEGTLAYLSPEQTGRMNRAIDYRTDFYALGITLYELLTGQLPFSSGDPLEMLHCHMAQRPAAIDHVNSQVPPMVAAIASKLMEKNAENRYQSALGLKYDLEQCLSQWQAEGAISEFKLGQRDVSDRFLIPEKLYGREVEVQTLLAAFDRVAQGTSELMLVAGFSGIGKTAVVNEVHKPIVQQQGYFIKGKFDQFNRDIPFSAIVQALQALIGQLLSESDSQLEQWRERILQALGKNGQVLIDVIPKLEQIIGPQPSAPDLSGSAAQNRFNLLFQKFIHVFTRREHLLVIFLDDLQWVDSASLALLKLLMNDPQGALFIIGAYRDNEVSPTHTLMLALDEMQQSAATINTITLKNLNQDCLNTLVADTLKWQKAIALPLSQFIHQKTQGNPFFSTQFLKTLHSDGLITFEPSEGRWQLDMVQVQAHALKEDVVALMAQQLQKLPIDTQAVIKLAACIGNQFDLATLTIVHNKSSIETATSLWPAVRVGLILPTSKAYRFYQEQDHVQSLETPQAEAIPTYRFLHDRVQQAAYSLIPDAAKQATHFKIGQRLQESLSAQEQADEIFDIVNQLNFGVALITAPNERLRLATLNLLAGRKAKASTAYTAATKYFSVGRQLLGTDSWQQAYELTLDLYEASAEAAFLSTDFEQAEQLAAVVLEQAQSVLDQVNIYIIKIQSKIAQVELMEAIHLAIKILKQIDPDLHLPETPTQEDFERSLAETRSNLANRDILGLLHLPKMKASRPLAVMRILASMSPPAYFAFPSLLPLVAMRIVNLSLQFGNTNSSAFGYAMYGFVLCGVVDDIEAGSQFGQLALNLAERFDTRDVLSKVLLLSGHFIQPWHKSLRECLGLLPNAYQVGLDTGDLEFAAYSASFYCFNSIFSGRDLVRLERDVARYGEAIAQLKQNHVLHQVKLTQQTLLNLLAYSEHPDVLIGEAYDEAKMVPLHKQANNRTTLAFLYIAKLHLSYLFEDYEQALENAAQAADYLDGTVAMLCIVLFHFYDSLIRLAQWPQMSSTKQGQSLEKIAYNQSRMDYWADHAPMNYRHKFYLVEAERARILGHVAEAIDYYERAIAGAKANGYPQEEALANELAARFYLQWGKEKVAAGYMQEAYYCYSHWGSQAKVTVLEVRYPKLLRSILQPSTPSTDVLTTLQTIAAPTPEHVSNSANQSFDLATILKASQVLSGSIQLDDLLRQLTHIILQNSGGDRCALILPNNVGEWQVRIIATSKENHLCDEHLNTYPNLPIPLIQYVKNTQEIVVIEDLATELPVVDTYLRETRPKSVLCLPLLNQGHLIGLLYLQNQLATDIFTKERILVLNFLCTQAAISLENAQLYQKIEQAFAELQRAQLQIVQSEKMSALGNLVAGVAHEINNPVGCIIGNVGATQDYINDLLGLLDLYADQFPEPGEDIEEELDAVDLEYVRDDLPKLIRAMEDSGDRINSISKSLRTFSRADTKTKQICDLHEGLDSTLLILRHRLKANEYRPAIDVIKDYGPIPDLACFPGQLNQVFMNILANAIDVLDDASQNRSFDEKQANPHKITIRTSMENDQVKVAIADNGPGIPEEIKAKIFDHLFTTKQVGKGTGLGLAIAHQIVVDIHGGRLDVHSEVSQGTEFCIRLPL